MRIPPPRSVLVVMMSAVGDAVQVLPVVNLLKKSYPEVRISWVIQPGPLELVRGHWAVDQFILFRRRSRKRTPRGLAAGLRSLRETAAAIRKAAAREPGGAFDLVLDLQTYFKAGVLTALAPARIKLGFDRGRARDLNPLFTTHRIPPHPRGHAHTQDQYLEFLSYLGAPTQPVEYGLTLTEEERASRDAFFRELGGPAFAMVLASSDPRKDWRPDGYARVAEEVAEAPGLQPIIVGGNTPREEEMTRRVMEATRVRVFDARGGGLRRLLWLLDGSRLVVSPDTGPLHMARGLERPVVGLYGFTNPRRSGPYRMFQDLVVDGYARTPGEDYPVNRERRRGGMGRITPEMVMEKVERALLLSPPGPR